MIERLALPLSNRITRSDFWKLAQQMERLERCPLKEIQAVQNDRLQRLFTVAATQIEFWKTRLSVVIDNDDQRSPLTQLGSLPLASKSELEAGFPDQVVDQSVDQSDLRFAATRGTTQRMICVHDFAKRDASRAATVRSLRASGYRIGMSMVEIPPDICDVVCGDQGERDEGVLRHVWEMARGGKLADVNAYRDLRGLIERHWIYNLTNYPSFGPFGTNPPIETLDNYIDWLAKDRPHSLKGLTTYLYQIAKRALERNDVQLKIPVIKPLGSGATPAMRETIETGFGGKFFNDYGSAELGGISSDCEIGNGMHVFSDLFVVEIVDATGKPVPPGEIGEVVVTDLVNYAMPLIRYKIGDLGRMDPTPCACGMNSPRIWIEGRVHDALRRDDGSYVTSFEIAERLYRIREVDQFQLVEKRHGALELTLVPAAGQNIDQAEIESLIRSLLRNEIRLRIRTARTIAAEPGGKFRWVKTQPTPIAKPANAY